jgi:hypothetical protein
VQLYSESTFQQKLAYAENSAGIAIGDRQLHHLPAQLKNHKIKEIEISIRLNCAIAILATSDNADLSDFLAMHWLYHQDIYPDRNKTRTDSQLSDLAE